MSSFKTLAGTVCLLPLLSACVGNADAPAAKAYTGPYSGLGNLCLVPEEDHSSMMDMLVVQALRDRGFSPLYIERGDREALRGCRSVVSFSNKGKSSANEMSLTYIDRYTGETYHVGTGPGEFGSERTALIGSPIAEPEWKIRKLVDRLFPESPLEGRNIP